MSGSTNPSISAVTSHLSVFQPYKYSEDHEENLTLSDYECDLEYDSDDEEDDNRRPPELRPGDYILFYDGGHQGNPRKLMYSQIISIKTFEDADGDMDATIGIDTFASFACNQNSMAVYRLDSSSGMLQDVTHTRFMMMTDLTLIDGDIKAGTYITDSDHISGIITRQQQRFNEQLVKQGVIRSVEYGVNLGVNTTNINPTVAVDKEVMSSIMEKVIAEINSKQKYYGDLSKRLSAKKKKKEEDKESIRGSESAMTITVDQRKQPAETLAIGEESDSSFGDDTDTNEGMGKNMPAVLEVEEASISKSASEGVGKNIPAVLEEASLSMSASSEGSDINSAGIITAEEASQSKSNSSEGSDINSNGIIYANLSTSDIQDLIDEQISGYSKPWKGSIPFLLRVLKSDMDVASIHAQPLQLLDVCDYLDGQGLTCKRLYFSEEKYKPPSKDADMKTMDKTGTTICAGFNELKRDLFIAAHTAGSPLVLNGSNNAGERKIKCSACYRVRRKSKAMPVTAANPYKTTSLVHNRRNNRGPQGISLSKRVKTPNQDVVCKLQFTLKWDKYGFYVELDRYSGCPIHNDHKRPLDISAMSYPSRLLSKEQWEDTCHVVAATSNKASGRNYILTKFDRFISALKVTYMKNKMDGNTSREDDISRMLSDFKESDDIKFTTLSDIPMQDLEGCDGGSNGTITVSTTKNDDGTITNTPVSQLLELASLKLDETAKQEREERAISEDDVMFMSVAWIVGRNFRLFKTCPEVVWCDVTSHSNNKGFHLLTFSCRLSVDRQLVFLWIWIPNQQRSSFRWVFQHALPILIPRFHRYRVKMIMKDGDFQQRNEILISLRDIFPNTVEAGCGYHIVQNSYITHGPAKSALTQNNRPRWLSIVRRIKKHIYSWMRPGYVETEEEYKISKYLLLQFVCSAAVLSAAEGKTFMIIQMLKWLRGYVFVHEQLYLHLLRCHIRCLNVSHSSQHEGTNYGEKSHSAPMQPTMNVNTAAETLNLQTNVKVSGIEEMISNDYLNPDKRWSTNPSAPFLTSFGEGLVSAVYPRVDNYDALRVGARSFQVRYKGHEANMSAYEPSPAGMEAYNEFVRTLPMNENEDEEEFSHVPIPIFERIRDVEIDEYGIMKCSCHRFECSGIFCEQQVCVAKSVHNAAGQEFDGFTHHDVSVRYHSSYMYLAYKKDTQENLQQMYHRLATKDTEGPMLRIEIPETMEIKPRRAHLSALDRLKNYRKEDINLELLDGMLSSTYTPDSMGNDAEYDMFAGMSDALQDMITPQAEKLFDLSASDANIPDAAAIGGVKTRETLKQLIESSCCKADEIGSDGAKELESVLLGFGSWCNQSATELVVARRGDSGDRYC